MSDTSIHAFLEEICGLLIIDERIRNLSHTQGAWQIERKGAYQRRYEHCLRAWPGYWWERRPCQRC